EAGGQENRDEEEDRPLHARGHGIVEDLPERVEGQDGKAADVEVRPQGQGDAEDGEGQAIPPAPLAKDVELATQGMGRAPERVVARELVHVEGDRPGREEGSGDERGDEDGECDAAADGRAQVSLPLAIAACTVWSVFSINDRSSSSCSRWLSPLARM